MSRYRQLKEKYDKTVKETLQANKQIIIDSFVEYYGEEFRKIIEKRINEIVFIYYFHMPTIDLVMKELFSDKKEKYKDFMEVFKEYSHEKNSKANHLPDVFIGTTDTSIADINYIKNIAKYCMTDCSPYNFNYFDGVNMKRIICFQVLALKPQSIIHEINHAVTSEKLIHVIGNLYIERFGLGINSPLEDAEDNIIEELINEKSAQDVYEIFKKRGGDLTQICKSIPLKSIYSQNLYLIEELYKYFTEVLKKARIMGNKNELVKRIGIKNFKRLTSIINTYYSKTGSVSKEVKIEALKQIKAIFKNINFEYIKDSNYISKELESFYKELEQRGYRVKVLSK